jgi:hypothetical protein
VFEHKFDHLRNSRPYIIRRHVADTVAVKKAVRAEILYRGDFAPRDEDSDGRWFDLSSDRALFARQLLEATRNWVIACYHGTRWLVPTVEGWREQACISGDASRERSNPVTGVAGFDTPARRNGQR